MGGISSSEVMSRFVPGALAWSSVGQTRLRRPVRETHAGSLLITDISGFTDLTSKLSRLDARAGAERISFVLNDFISRLVAEIELHGGSILGLEGDSVLAGWKAESASALADVTWRACYCAQSLHRKSWSASADDEALSLRSGVAAGNIEFLHVLQNSQQRRLILAGTSVDEVFDCALLAERGEVLVSESAWRFVRDVGEGLEAAAGTVRLNAIRTPSSVQYLGTFAQDVGFDASEYVPSFLASRLRSALSHWLAEIRTITAVFVNLQAPALLEDVALLDDRLDHLQKTISRYGGDILKLSGSRPGLHALCTFGLPSHAHKDDARRGAQAALELQSFFNKADVRLSIGLATGEVFCGAIGTQYRADYTVIGDAVNRSARLSVIAAGRILADDTTAHAAANAVNFDGPWPLQVRGVRTPVDAFVAVSIKRSALQAREELVGREKEMARLSDIWRAAGSGRQVLVIEGAPGIGKSALIESFAKDSRANGTEVVLAIADDIERETPYFVFRQIIRNLVGLHDLEGQDPVSLIEERLQHRPDLLPLIPLLRDLFDLGPETASKVDSMTGATRSENLKRFLREIIEDQIASRKTVLVLEDVHWMDSSSKNVLQEVLSKENNISTILTTRDASGFVTELGLDQTNLLKLEPLSNSSSKELMSRLLATPIVNDEFEESALSHAGGNPLFIGEICHAINLRQVVDNKSAPSLKTQLITLPQSARSAILGRMDALPPDHQVVLKVASAMPTNFTLEELKAVSIVDETTIDVAACLRGLVLHNLIKPVASMDGKWTFSHAIVRDAVYDSMLAAQRQETHASIAESIEATGRASEAETLPLIVNQWQRAGNRRRMVGYVDQLAKLRLRQFDNASAIGLIELMLSTVAEEEIAVPVHRQAVAHFVLAEARLNIGRMEAAQSAYEQGMKLLGLPMPEGAIGVAWQLTLQLGEQILRRLAGGRQLKLLTRQTSKEPLSDELFLEAARAFENLTGTYYFHHDKLRLLLATLRATNLAGRYGEDTPVLAVNYASLGTICGVIPLPRQAKTYHQLASGLAERLADPAVDARINLLNGLYETAVANWGAAKTHFDSGIRQALQLGDSRRWLELAVSLEMISNPWLHSPVFSSIDEWKSLVEHICLTGRKQGDLPMLGCGLVAGIRGYHAVKDSLLAGHYGHYLADISALLEDPRAEFEKILVVEALAYLAEAALERGETQVADKYLAKGTSLVETMRYAMKSRTLPALCALFSTAMRSAKMSEGANGRRDARRSAAMAKAKLKEFARVYQIGRPYALLHEGDYDLSENRKTRAFRSWQNAVAEATRLELPVVGLEALKRLKAARGSWTPEQVAAAALFERQMAIPRQPRKSGGVSGTVYT